MFVEWILGRCLVGIDSSIRVRLSVRPLVTRMYFNLLSRKDVLGEMNSLREQNLWRVIPTRNKYYTTLLVHFAYNIDTTSMVT